MWPNRPGSSALVLVLSAVLVLLSESALAQDGPALPTGAGSDIVALRCLTCHQADLIVEQRLDEVGWGRELDKMIRWGAPVTDDERPAMVRYLAASFGRRPAATSADLRDPASAVYARACLVCHQADIIEQQRLTRAGWARELDKMLRWGATVSAEEQGPLINYLTDRFGPRDNR